MSKKVIMLVGSILLLAFAVVSFAQNNVNTITKQEIITAQKNWADGVVRIGQVYAAGGNYSEAALNFINKFYAYQYGPVLFKPTKALEKQFRLTKAGALSYFVGGNKKFPEDLGFALHPWISIRFDNAEFFIHGDYAVVMGKYFFTPKKGKIVEVEYTFGYLKDQDGNLKINLHHSSLPYK